MRQMIGLTALADADPTNVTLLAPVFLYLVDAPRDRGVPGG